MNFLLLNNNSSACYHEHITFISHMILVTCNSLCKYGANLSATCFITQYFTLNITILHAVFVCIKWERGFYDLYVHGNKQKNYCL